MAEISFGIFNSDREIYRPSVRNTTRIPEKTSGLQAVPAGSLSESPDPGLIPFRVSHPGENRFSRTNPDRAKFVFGGN